MTEVTAGPVVGRRGDALLACARTAKREIAQKDGCWGVDGRGSPFRLVAGAQRHRLVELFGSLPAAHTPCPRAPAFPPDAWL